MIRVKDGAALAPEEVRQAVCRETDPEVFFEATGHNPWQADVARIAWAKRVCEECPIRRRCLEVALVNGEQFGVFGGLTADERRPLLRRKAAA